MNNDQKLLLESDTRHLLRQIERARPEQLAALATPENLLTLATALAAEYREREEYS